MVNKKYVYRATLMIFLFFLFQANFIFGQATGKISISQAIQYGLKNSGYIKLSKLKIREAVSAYHEAKDNRLPDLKASGSAMRLNNPSVDLKVKLGSGGGQSKPVSVNQVYYGMANASLPVFAGFKIKFGIESAKYLEQATRLDADNQKEEVVENIINAYCNFFKAQKSVELLKRNMKQQGQRVADLANLEKNGILSLNDLLKAKLQLSNVELALLDAENNYKVAGVNLCLLIGLPEDEKIEPDSAMIQTNHEAGAVADWEQIALKNRKDLNALGFREKASETAVKLTKGEYFPGLALTGGYIAANIPGLLTIKDALNVGVGIQYNLSSIWKTQTKVKTAQIKLDEVRQSENILTDQIRLQINQAYYNYTLSTNKTTVYLRAIEQAKENYRISNDKYKNSLITLSDLLEADLTELQAEMNHTFAKTDEFLAYLKLQMAAGVLSENYK